MKKFIVVWIRCFLLLSIFSNLASAERRDNAGGANLADVHYVPGQIVVKFKPQPRGPQTIEQSDAFIRLLQTHNVQFVHRVFKNAKGTLELKGDAVGLSRVYLLTVPLTTNIVRVVAELRQNSAIEYAEPH